MIIWSIHKTKLSTDWVEFLDGISFSELLSSLFKSFGLENKQNSFLFFLHYEWNIDDIGLIIRSHFCILQSDHQCEYIVDIEYLLGWLLRWKLLRIHILNAHTNFNWPDK